MHSGSEKGVKWWLRYIVFGSGGLVIAIASFISLKCSSNQADINKSSRLDIKQGIVGSNISTKSGSVYIVTGGIGCVQQNGADKFSREISETNKVAMAPVKEIIGRSGFFNLKYGTLSILPNIKTRLAAVNADTFLILSPGNSMSLRH